MHICCVSRVFSTYLLCEQGIACLQAASLVCSMLLAEGALELVGAHA